MLDLALKQPTCWESYLEAGIQAYGRGDHAAALLNLRRAAGCQLSQPEPWLWMGKVQEAKGDRVAAGYCYELALTLGHGFEPARDALKRLGYLQDPDVSSLWLDRTHSSTEHRHGL